MKPITVYLAGGLTSNWQEQVINEIESDYFIFYNPRVHGLESAKEYTTWDLFYVEKCDVVFAYMEKENPSGYGLTLEVGFAKAMNKKIILIDERSDVDKFFKDKFKIVRNSASVYYKSLEAGISFLKSFEKGVCPEKTIFYETNRNSF